MKRTLSLLLAVIMVLSLVPAVYAAEDQLAVSGLTPTYGQAKLVDWYTGELTDSETDGTVIWSSNGNMIQSEARYSNTKLAGARLTLTNTSGADATLKFDYTLAGGTARFEDDLIVSDPYDEGETATGSYTYELTAGQSVTIEIMSASYDSDYDEWFEQNAKLTIANISLASGGDQTVTFQPVEGGSYTVNGTALDAEKSYTAPSGTEYTLAATAADGYQFFGWYNETTSSYVSYDATAKLGVTGNWTIYPVFLSADKAIFAVGSVKFDDLSKADAFANGGTIVLMNDGILTGEHTISAGNTLLIPYDDANTVHTKATATAIPPENKDGPWTNVEWETPRAYRTLTMAAGAKLTVAGSLNVGGKHSAGGFLTAGSPSGDLGMIQMAAGSNITVTGTLHCWGYIYGDGTVTVKNGGEVHENFQFTDFRGGNATLGIAQTFLAFPLSQYYVQNIEVATTFAYGAVEYVWGSLFLGSNSQVYGTSVKFIGNDNLCMFVPGVNGSVTKRYDPKTDRLIIDVDGDGAINPMAVELGGNRIDTQDFPLPINSNMTININSGTTALNQSLALLPGSELTIGKNATLSLKAAEPHKNSNGDYVHYTGANNLIVYDRDQWFSAYKPIIDEFGVLMGAEPVDTYFVYSKNGFKRLEPVAWTPTRTGTRTEANLVDAKLDINGKLITDGFIYTTVGLDLEAYFMYGTFSITGGGAAVTSSQGTGMLVMNNGMGMDSITLQPYQNSEKVEFAYLPMISARLQNRDGSYLDTLGAAPEATFGYCKVCGCWYAGVDNHTTVDITWLGDGKDATQEVCKGTKPVYNNGIDPVKEGYEFIGWSTENDNVPEYTAETLPNADTDATYYACFQEKADGVTGDLDQSGDVDSNDLTLLARHLAGIEELTAADALKNADTNGDEELSSDDLTQLARYIAGIITDWNE